MWWWLFWWMPCQMHIIVLPSSMLLHERPALCSVLPYCLHESAVFCVARVRRSFVIACALQPATGRQYKGETVGHRFNHVRYSVCAHAPLYWTCSNGGVGVQCIKTGARR